MPFGSQNVISRAGFKKAEPDFIFLISYLGQIDTILLHEETTDWLPCCLPNFQRKCWAKLMLVFHAKVPSFSNDKKLQDHWRIISNGFTSLSKKEWANRGTNVSGPISLQNQPPLRASHCSMCTYVAGNVPPPCCVCPFSYCYEN